MIHARIDTVEHRQIVGFEVGTRAAFDVRHGGDPLWIYVESYRVKLRADLKHFMMYPSKYKILATGDVILTTDTPIVIPDVDPVVPIGYVALKGRDGRYLLGADGAFLLGYDGDYTPPPAGKVYLTDPDNKFLKDPDDKLITESE